MRIFQKTIGVALLIMLVLLLPEIGIADDLLLATGFIPAAFIMLKGKLI